MPLHIVNRNQELKEVVLKVSSIELESCYERNIEPFERLREIYAAWIKRAMAEKQKSLWLASLQERDANISQATLNVKSIKMVRDLLPHLVEDELHIYLALDRGMPLYPELELQLTHKHRLREQASLKLNCCFSKAPDFSVVDAYEDEAIEAVALEECCCFKESSLDELIKNKPLTFSQLLLKMLDERAISDVEFYKRANIDRKLFSKIRNKDYKPSKNTVLAAVVSLKLSVEEAEQLMAAAGYTWNRSDNTDIIVMYFLRRKDYDIDRLNLALYDYGEKTLGAKMA